MATGAEIAAARDTTAALKAGFNASAAAVTSAASLLSDNTLAELASVLPAFNAVSRALVLYRPVLIKAIADVAALVPSDQDNLQMLGPSGLSSGAFDSKMRYGATE